MQKCYGHSQIGDSFITYLYFKSFSQNLKI